MKVDEFFWSGMVNTKDVDTEAVTVGTERELCGTLGAARVLQKG